MAEVYEDRSEELLGLLSVPVRHMRPASWRGRRPFSLREVYRGDKSSLWFLTYSREIPDYEPFRRHDVDRLLARGLIVSTYPDDPRSANECFTFSPSLKESAHG